MLVAFTNHYSEVGKQLGLNVLHVFDNFRSLQVVPLVEVYNVLDVSFAHLKDKESLVELLVVQVVHADEVLYLDLQVLLSELIAHLSNPVH